MGFDCKTGAQKKISHTSQEKIWLIIDELHSLRKIEHPEDPLAELRKYGGAVILATQNISQLSKIYGYHGARTILDQCGTKVSFKQSDAEIAKMMANPFGQREFTENQQGISCGAHEMQDGVTLSSIDRTRTNVTSTQIMTLPDLQGFIKLPGN